MPHAVNLKYRPDIDGLRAVAVLSIVLYHGFPALLPGGFCGVDIFFVISGYLISGILYKGHLKGNFSFREFYARRIRRIFPSLITVLILCFLLGYRLLLSSEFESLGKHIAAGTLFIQNFVFWHESGYFDKAANLKPMLHLWSLAVEEQFYIFFPPLLLLLWRRSWMMAPVIALLFVSSFCANLIMSFQAPESDFFLTPYRTWEFLGGSLLAWWHFDNAHEEDVPIYRNSLSLLGTFFLIFSLAWIHKGDPFPGWRALMPVFGTLLLIEGGSGAWVNRHLLSNPAVVLVGLISYPLYLFHWPLLSFLQIVRSGHPDKCETVFALLASLALATLTYYFIEKKVRYATWKGTAAVLIVLFVGLGVIGALVWDKKIIPRASLMGFDAYVAASQDNHYFAGFQSVSIADNYMKSSAGGSGAKTLFLGDSHMEQCAPRILRIILAGGAGTRGVAFVTRRGTVPIPGVIDTRHVGPGFSEKILQEALSPDVDRVVITANWCPYFNWGGKYNLLHDHALSSEEGSQDALLTLQRMMERLRQEGKTVYLILNAPTDGDADPILRIKRSLLGNFQIMQSHQTTKEFSEVRGEMPYTQGELMDKLASVAHRAGAEVINPLDYLAPEGVFPQFDEGRPVYHDTDHLTATYMRDRASYLDKTILP